MSLGDRPSQRAIVEALHDDISVVIWWAHRQPDEREGLPAWRVVPTTLGEWLARASSLGASAACSAPGIDNLLGPATRPHGSGDGRDPSYHSRVAAGDALEFAGALWRSFCCSAGLPDDESERHAAAFIAADASDVYYDEVLEEGNGLSGALGALGSALYAYMAFVSRGSVAPHHAITEELREGLLWLAAALTAANVVDKLIEQPEA